MTETTTNPPAEPANDEVAAAPPAEAAVDPVEAARKEAAELKDKLLRALAEMENLRRRAEREAADARQYGIAQFARDVLGVADNMRRALDAVGADLRNQAEGGVRSLIDGVDLTERELLRVMEKHGIKRFEPQGEKFDPNLHQAMYEVPDATAAPGTVVQVMQAGYRLGDRVLRPALVGVAKGGAKAANGATGNGGNGGATSEAAESTSQRTA